jgi:protein required for attachment to host cells
MKKDTWVLVANSSMAKIFKAEKNRVLKELEVMEHPESRLHDRDLVTSRPGRTFNSVGASRHAMEPQTSPKEVEFTNFARQISERLNQARAEGLYHKLYVVASPSFLGLLRQILNSSVTQVIAGEVSKDMTQSLPEDIREHLPYAL